MLKAAGGGAIINVSSSTARTGLPRRLPYAVSKVAVLGMTDTLARELGPYNIRVNSVLPGWIDNARGNARIEEVARQMGVDADALKADSLRYISMRTQIQPDEIAEMMDDLDILAGGMKHLGDRRIRHQLEEGLEVEPFCQRIDENFDCRARHLDQAEFRPEGRLSQELCIDGDEV